MGPDDRLDGLSRQEKAACLITEKVLGAIARAWDVHGRQGVVDAMLTLPDGRQAALEVTALAANGAFQTDALLGRDDFGWPSPGRWWWTVQVVGHRETCRAYERPTAASHSYAKPQVPPGPSSCEAAGHRNVQGLTFDRAAGGCSRRSSASTPSTRSTCWRPATSTAGPGWRATRRLSGATRPVLTGTPDEASPSRAVIARCSLGAAALRGNWL